MAKRVQRFPIDFLEGRTLLRYSEDTGELLEEISPQAAFERANAKEIPRIPAAYGPDGVRVNLNEDTGEVISYDMWVDADSEPAKLSPVNVHARIEKQTLLKLPEAASYLEISDGTLRRWIYQGKIPYRQPGRAYMFLKQDLDEFLERQKKIHAPSSSIKSPTSKKRKPDYEKIARNLGLGRKR